MARVQQAAADPSAKPSRWRRFAAVLPFAAVAGIALFALLAWNASDRQDVLDAWRGRLRALADDRHRSVEIWITERIEDLHAWASFPTVGFLLGDRRGPPFPFPVEEGAVPHLGEILSIAQGAYRYSGVWLLAADGSPIAASRGAPEMDEIGRAIARHAAPNGEARLEFRRRDGAVRLTVALAVRGSDGPAHRGGILFAEIDPGTLLYPLLETEPLPTATGEALLVEPIGGELVYLSPARHAAAGPLDLRGAALPGGLALPPRGATGTFETGRDYRGERVLAAIEPIARTSWLLIAKVDEEEALAPFRAAAKLRALGLALIVGLAAVATVASLRARRIRAEARSLKNRTQLASLLDFAHEAVFLVGADGRILNANRRAFDLYGYPPGELLGMPISRLRADADEAATERLSGAIRREGSKIFESQHRRRDGSLVPVEVSSTAIELEGATNYLALVRDIGSRKALEELRAGELRVLEKIAAGAPLVAALEELALSVEAHAAGAMVSILRLAGERLFHVAGASLPEEFRRAIDGQAIGPARGSCGTAAFLGQPVTVSDIATDPLWADFRELAARFDLRACWSVPIRGADGAVQGTFAIYHREARAPRAEERALIESAIHIAAIALDRDQVEERLRRSLAELRAIFDNSAFGIALVDREGRPIQANPALARLLGYEPDELARMSFPEFTHPDDRELDLSLYRTLLAGERDFYQLEKRYLRKNGEVVPTRLTVSAVRDADRSLRYAIGMVEDLSERRRLQQEVEQAQKMEAVGRLAGGIAHDFNNILGVILGYGSLMVAELDAEHPMRPPLDEILAAADRAALLTRQLLAFSRRQAVELQVLDLHQVVEELGGLLRRLIGEDVALEVAPDPESGCVRADRSQIDQILMNLAVNARDAMPRGGRLRIATRNVDLDAEFAERHPEASPGPHVLLEVVDDGAGMDEATAARAFEPFFSTKGPGRGTGLGLSTVYGIVRQSGGTILLESSPGAGTRFAIYLPRVDARPTPAAKSAPPVARGSERVLVVEDEPSLRALVRRQLASLGFDAQIAEDAGHALRLLADPGSSIDVLLTDLVMPDMPGIELSRSARALRPGLHVLFMSGYSDEVFANHGAPEAAAMIAKPFTAGELARKLRELLDAP